MGQTSDESVDGATRDAIVCLWDLKFQKGICIPTALIDDTVQSSWFISGVGIQVGVL